MAAASYMLSVIQHGIEATPGTLVPATFKHAGKGTLKFEDSMQQPGFDYAAGFAGGVIEPSFIADTGAMVTWADTQFTAEDMMWLGNMGIKTSLTTASADSVNTFAYPTTAANSISTFTHELGTPAQEWEFGNAVCTDFSIHGDVGANNGQIMYNAKHSGRVSAASTVTGALGLLANRHPLNINYATLHFDAIGTAAGTASATAAVFRAFTYDVVTGWELRKYGDGRSAKDGSVAVYKNYEIKGTVKLDLDSATVTRIANARAATPEIMAIKMNGAGGRLVVLGIPLAWTDISEMGADDGGIISVTLNYRGGYSTTSSAQGPSVLVTASASITVT